MDELTRRATAAYFRAGGTDQSAKGSSGAAEADGKQYVVLRNVRGIMAVYRVRNDGKLKGLRRWPAALEAQEGAP